MRLFITFLVFVTSLSLVACKTTGPDLDKFDYMNNRLGQLPAEQIPTELATNSSSPYYQDMLTFTLIKGLYENNVQLIDTALQCGVRADEPIMDYQNSTADAMNQLNAQIYNRWYAQYAAQGITEYVMLTNMRILQLGDVYLEKDPFAAMDMVRSHVARERLERYLGRSMSHENMLNSLTLAVYLQDQPMIAYWQAQGVSLDHIFPSQNTLLHIATIAGKPNSIRYLADLGANVNVLRPTPSYGDKTIVLENASLLHSVLYETSIVTNTKVAVIRALTEKGANPNIATKMSVYQRNQLLGTLDHMAPLHVQAFLESQMTAQAAQTVGMPSVREALVAGGANQMALNSQGRTAVDMIQLTRQERQQRADAAARAAAQEQQLRQQSSFDPGKLIAGAAILGLGAYGMSQGGEMATRAIEIAGSGLADIMSDGQTNYSQQAYQQALQNQQSSSAANVVNASTPVNLQTERYRISCPSGVFAEIPLSYNTQACRTAQIDFAQTYSCNDYQRFEAVHQGCQQGCGSRDCEQK